MLAATAAGSKPTSVPDGHARYQRQPQVIAALETRFYETLMDLLEIPPERRLNHREPDQWPQLQRQLVRLDGRQLSPGPALPVTCGVPEGRALVACVDPGGRCTLDRRALPVE